MTMQCSVQPSVCHSTGSSEEASSPSRPGVASILQFTPPQRTSQYLLTSSTFASRSPKQTNMHWVTQSPWVPLEVTTCLTTRATPLHYLQWHTPHTAGILPCPLHAPQTHWATSTHSLQIGAATTAAAAGIPTHTIKQLGRWRSSAYRSYIRPREHHTGTTSLLAHHGTRSP